MFMGIFKFSKERLVFVRPSCTLFKTIAIFQGSLAKLQICREGEKDIPLRRFLYEPGSFPVSQTYCNVHLRFIPHDQNSQPVIGYGRHVSCCTLYNSVGMLSIWLRPLLELDFEEQYCLLLQWTIAVKDTTWVCVLCSDQTHSYAQQYAILIRVTFKF